MTSPLEAWHQGVVMGDISVLDEILDKEVVFYSPIVFKQQKGRAITKAYLTAAFNTFKDAGFHYVKELIEERQAILEFNTEIDRVLIDGVDIITWNEQGKITEFKVMIRPFRAIEKVGEKMKEQLNKLGTLDKLKIGASKLFGK
ncbi:MAG: nuclear transport factor 2 family protein [Cytophagales bacterium]|nr:nuclear transport factor 2 family protein [Cytophagales bacterium]